MYYYIEVSCKYVEENDIRIFCAYTFFIDVRHLTIHTPFIISGFYSFLSTSSSVLLEVTFFLFFFFLFFLQFDSRYQNVPIRQNKSWFQNFQISKGWATIRLQNGAQGRPALCSILWLNCGLAIWVRKVLKTVLFMVYGYILILGMVFQFRDDDFQTFLRVTP